MASRRAPRGDGQLSRLSVLGRADLPGDGRAPDRRDQRDPDRSHQPAGRPRAQGLRRQREPQGHGLRPFRRVPVARLPRERLSARSPACARPADRHRLRRGGTGRQGRRDRHPGAEEARVRPHPRLRGEASHPQRRADRRSAPLHRRDRLFRVRSMSVFAAQRLGWPANRRVATFWPPCIQFEPSGSMPLGSEAAVHAIPLATCVRSRLVARAIGANVPTFGRRRPIRTGAPHTNPKSPACSVAWFEKVIVSTWASRPEWICHWSVLPIWLTVAPCSSVPKPLSIRKSHPSTWLRLKSATVAPLALPARSTKVSLPAPPIRVFAPRLTSVSAPLLPVPVSPEPLTYRASTLAGRV